jgi:hypothetical protein
MLNQLQRHHNSLPMPMHLHALQKSQGSFNFKEKTNMPNYNNSTVNTAAVAPIIITSVIISLVFIVLAAIIYWKIFSKAGYSGAIGLLMFVPIANLVVLLMLAFAEWPIYKELNFLRQQVAQGQQYRPSPQQFPSSPQYPQYGQPQQYGQGQSEQYGQSQSGQQPQSPQYPQS